ncbi:hypothetical protein BS47DRAFT_1358971 [Hydnum rufescens UP504]|uniref:Uncharacterized protein n=1 Tax=Hydnum rufescens UP504 TaxID=1448309 RepID=A0A9P6E0R6_9AGAM|nr:hypothetical protein BS47DRAFT_1358971 [Hydnum rufescens UP504]
MSTPPAALPEDRIPLLRLSAKLVQTGIATSGTTFKDKNALLTGVGKGSIGVEVIKGLLSGPAHVIITTWRYSHESVEYYEGILQAFGRGGSALTVQDVNALVNYIYSAPNLDLDYILPFASIPENGRDIDGVDDKSEVAHCVMLVNLLHLLGAAKTKKASTPPTQVSLPLSPNHVPKAGANTWVLRARSLVSGPNFCFSSTRATGLMSATNMLAEHIEAHGARTFSAKEMAFNILGLMHPLLPQHHSVQLPELESPESLADLAPLQSLLDLDKVLVITGFTEVGPWGSSRTRWEMEARGSLPSKATLKWPGLWVISNTLMGNSRTVISSVDWVDAKTGEPVDDKVVKTREKSCQFLYDGLC